MNKINFNRLFCSIIFIFLWAIFLENIYAQDGKSKDRNPLRNYLPQYDTIAQNCPEKKLYSYVPNRHRPELLINGYQRRRGIKAGSVNIITAINEVGKVVGAKNTNQHSNEILANEGERLARLSKWKPAHNKKGQPVCIIYHVHFGFIEHLSNPKSSARYDASPRLSSKFAPAAAQIVQHLLPLAPTGFESLKIKSEEWLEWDSSLSVPHVTGTYSTEVVILEAKEGPAHMVKYSFNDGANANKNRIKQASKAIEKVLPQRWVNRKADEQGLAHAWSAWNDGSGATVFLATDQSDNPTIMVIWQGKLTCG